MYKFTDNAMESGVAVCDTDITNDNFMHLKYSDKSDFICEAPNGVLSYSELTITAPSGLKIALAKGRDDNKAMVSSLLILNDAVSLDVTDEYSGASVFINKNKQLVIKKREVTQDPTVTSASASDTYLYNTKTNFYYDENGQTLVIGRLGEIYSTVGAIQGLIPKEVFRAVDYQELAEILSSKANIDLFNLNNNGEIKLGYPRGCFNFGAVDENGEAALLKLNNNIITLKSPAIYTDGLGNVNNINEDLTLDISNLEDGEYSLRVKKTQDGFNFYATPAKIYRQKFAPTNPQTGDILQDLSVAPWIFYEFDGQDWLPTNAIEAGKLHLNNSDSEGGGVRS